MEQLPPIIHSSWHPLLEPLFQTAEIKYLKYTVLPNCNFFPAKEDIFNVFSMPLSKIKVVILGQDPYPQPNQAIGYAFAVSETVPMPKSLQIIAKELELEGLKSGFYDSDIPHWKTLHFWREQGVFLLNTALTVQKGRAGSHLSYWKPFVNAVISEISVAVDPVWLLWGNHAKSYQSSIRIKTHVLTAPHPAAEAYAGGKAGFYGCDHFNKTNQILLSQNKQIINW